VASDADVDKSTRSDAKGGGEATVQESDGYDSDVVLIDRPAEFKASTRKTNRDKNAPFGE
jgi:hypothetical protein